MSGRVGKAGIALWFLVVAVSPAWCAEVGEQVPDFNVRTFDGRSFSRKALTGKPIMLVFWNTWCEECKTELPRVNELAKRFGPEGVTILAVNTGLNDSETKARVYWKKYGYSFPVGIDRSFEIGRAFKVRGVPAVYLVDSQGMVRYRSPLLPADIEERIKKLKN